MRAKGFCLSLILLLLSLREVRGQTATTANQPPPASVLLKKTVGFVRVLYLKENQPWEARGTGFFVIVEDKRLGENRGFLYLITNRHVAEPEENGQRLPVLSVSLRLNLKRPVGGTQSQEGIVPLGGALHWYFSTDGAVDLAVLPISPDQEKYDYVPFPSTMFATSDVIEKDEIAEGDQVFFAGFFYQFPGLSKIEPIVRQGILAMMPGEPMETTLHRQGRMYLADVHVFGGNGGAPLFVNLAGFRNGKMIVGGFPYRLLGVVSGYMIEDANFRLRVATTLEGKVEGNSGISMVVPVDELKTILDSAELQRLRDAEAAREKGARN